MKKTSRYPAVNAVKHGCYSLTTLKTLDGRTRLAKLKSQIVGRLSTELGGDLTAQ